jgi:hypothetical protein
MARAPKQDYGPEIHNSVRDPTMRKDKRANPPNRGPKMTEAQDDAADKQAGIAENMPRDLAIDKQRGLPPDPPSGGQLSPHHVTAAAGIAHSILNHGRGGG